MLREALKVVLDIQELDIQMIRLMRLKRERQMELVRLRSLRDDLHHQVVLKENEIVELKKRMRLLEIEVAELVAKAKKLEAQQNQVKKVEEFNALGHEIVAVERQKATKEQELSDLYDKLAAEEDLLKSLKATYDATKINSEQLEKEIYDSIVAINAEGTALKQQRDAFVFKADPEIMKIYEKLLRNKKDRVVVPIENRCCSGCHILITAQHENLVRKGDKLAFCEHCSRIHYWHDYHVEGEEAQEGASRRRRRATAKT